MTDKIAKLGIACSMWHTSSKAFYSKQQERFTFPEEASSTVKNWELYLDKNVDMIEHCKAKSAYMVDMEISNNDMTYMCYCNDASGAYIAGQILLEEGIAEAYEIILDEAALWYEGKELFDYDGKSIEYLRGLISCMANTYILWIHLTQEGADFFRSQYEKEPKGMEDLS